MTDNGGRSRIRYLVILGLLAAAYTAGAVAFSIASWPSFCERYSLGRHLEAYIDDKQDNIQLIPVVAYSSTFPITVLRTVRASDRDDLHTRIEAVLAEPGEMEKERSLRSWIPEGTELIGASEENGYIFIDLSEEMENAPDIAYEEIGRSLSLWKDYKGIRFMICGRPTDRIYTPSR